MSKRPQRTTDMTEAGQLDIEVDAIGSRDAGNVERAEGIAADRLRSIVERWERLQEEVKALRSDQKDIMQEAKSAGYEPKVIRRLIADRAKEPADVEEAYTLLDLYRRALGM